MKNFLFKTIGSFDKNDGWAYASHIALSSLLAIFPFMIFVTSLAAMLGYNNLENVITAIVFGTWPEVAAEPIVDEIELVLENWHGGLFSLGGVLAFVFASNGVDALRTAFNRAYGVRDDRSFIYQRLLSLLLVIAGSLVLIFISFVLVFHPLLWPDYGGNFMSAIRYLIAGAILLFALCACHIWLPAGTRSMSSLWLGIVATMVLLSIATLIFSLHLQYLANYGALFGGLAGAITSLMYLYIVACILIFGGELNTSSAVQKKDTIS